MAGDVCGQIPLWNDAHFSEDGCFPRGEFPSDKECLLKEGHEGDHICFLKWRKKYVPWRAEVEGIDFSNMCEQCPWASDENLAEHEECTCMSIGEISEADALKLIKESFS